MIKVAFYDTKPYDREFFSSAEGSDRIDWSFHEFRLSADSASTTQGSEAVCVFVNDVLDRPCLEILVENGVRLVALRCAGFNNIDLDAAKELGLRVVRVPAYSPHAVAEHAAALLLTVNRKIHRAYQRVREQNFSLNGLVGFDLHGKTASIIGTGKIGKIFATILKGFGMNVLVNDLYPDEEWAAETGVRYVDLSEAIQSADVVSLHSPLTEDTLHLIDEDSLAQFKKGAVLINTSRGKLIDTSALISALKTGRLGGVGLDVYEIEEGVFFEDLSNEILPDDELARLLTFPNVVITWHQGFLTAEALGEIARVTTTNLLHFSKGEDPLAGSDLS